jgi:hypothetical protein
MEDLVLVVRNNGTTHQHRVSPSGICSGDGDDQFEPGERWRDGGVNFSSQEIVKVTLYERTGPQSSQLASETQYPGTAPALASAESTKPRVRQPT